MAERKLPGHISAALSRAGGPTDSAGIPWQGRSLDGNGNPLHSFAQDDGAADPGYLTAVGRLLAGTCDEVAVIESLAAARVFVPIVASIGAGTPAESGLAADKQADMAMVSLKAPDGRKALPVFSTVRNLQNWHSGARPVAVHAPRAALSAVAEDAQLLVIDPGAEFTFVVRRPAVWALARQRSWSPSYADPRVVDRLSAAIDGEETIMEATASPGRGVASRTAAGRAVPGGGPGPELAVSLRIHPGLTQAEVGAMSERFQRRLAEDAEFTELVDSLEVRLNG